MGVHSLPEPPVPPISSEVLNALGEPSLSSLGLCSYWPSGWYQASLEFLHVSADLPWWAAIATTTLIIRLCLFPFLLNQRRHLTQYTERMPHLTVLQDQMTHARLAGDYFQMMRISTEIQDYLRKNEVNPLKGLKILVVQIPVFLSVFGGIREMASLPVESMRTGGLFWFADLTVADPYYLLPLISMGSILLVFEVGAEVSTQNMTPIMRNALRVFPLIGFFMVMNMPSALLLYWTVSNGISLVQAQLFRFQAVRTLLKIPITQNAPPTVLRKRGFLESFKETLTNSRLLAELEARERLDAKSWQQSARGAVPRTYSQNPKAPPPLRSTGTVVNDYPPQKVEKRTEKIASGHG